MKTEVFKSEPYEGRCTGIHAMKYDNDDSHVYLTISWYNEMGRAIEATSVELSKGQAIEFANA